MNTKTLIQYLATLDIEKNHVDIYAFDERVQHKHPINQDLITLIDDLGEDLQKVDVFVVQTKRRRLLKTFESQTHANYTPIPSQNEANPEPMTRQTYANYEPIPSQKPSIQTPNLGGLEGYLITDLKDKNRELKTDLKELQIENKKLEQQVIQLERTLLEKEKDFEIERLLEEKEVANAKGGLSGFMEKAVENPQIMDVLGTVLGRVVGMETSPQTTKNEVEEQQEPTGNNVNIRQNIDKWFASLEVEKARNIYDVLMLIYKNEGLENEILQAHGSTETTV